MEPKRIGGNCGILTVGSLADRESMYFDQFEKGTSRYPTQFRKSGTVLYIDSMTLVFSKGKFLKTLTESSHSEVVIAQTTLKLKLKLKG